MKSCCRCIPFICSKKRIPVISEQELQEKEEVVNKQEDQVDKPTERRASCKVLPVPRIEITKNEQKIPAKSIFTERELMSLREDDYRLNSFAASSIEMVPNSSRMFDEQIINNFKEEFGKRENILTNEE